MDIYIWQVIINWGKATSQEEEFLRFVSYCKEEC